MKRFFSLFVAIALVAGLCPSSAFAGSLRMASSDVDASDSEYASGTLRDCDWSVSYEGTLVISPTKGKSGRLAPSGNNWDNSPWRDDDLPPITAVKILPGVSLSGSAERMFANLIALESVDLSGLDTSSVKDMTDMFSGCESLEKLDISGLDTSSVKDMAGMFSGCESLEKLDISGLDTSSVKDMGSMFSGCVSLKGLDLSGFDTSSVKDMTDMFSGCETLKKLDVSGFDTSSAKDMSGMFSGCESLKRLDLSGFDTSRVEDMSLMFSGCESLRGLDVSGFDTPRVSEMVGMFSGCKSLKKLDVSKFDASSLERASRMFQGCAKLKKIDLTWLTRRVAGRDMLSGCGLLKKVVVGPDTRLRKSCGLLSGTWKMKPRHGRALVCSTSSIIAKARKGKAGKYAGTWKLVGDAANPMTVAGNQVEVKASRLRHSAKKISRNKAFAVENAKGKVTFEKMKGSKKVKVSKKGKLKVAKGAKRGVYWVKVAVTAAGNKVYLPATETVKVRVRVV